MNWLTATVGTKGQITLPKKVRQAIGAVHPGDLVGFLVDENGGVVKIVRMDVRPAEESYTAEEMRKLVGLAKEKGGKTFGSSKDFLKHLDRM
jgi:AbrB family looped-hinge helix DNA binding protein